MNQSNDKNEENDKTEMNENTIKKETNGRIAHRNTMEMDTGGGDCAQVQPSPNGQPVSVIPKSTSLTSPPATSPPVDDDQQKTEDFNEPLHIVDTPQDRRPSICERRNFRTPLSAPHDVQNLSTNGNTRRVGVRKTSLPARPAGLELPSSGDGGVNVGRRRTWRLSESNRPDEEGDYDMPKSVSDHYIGSGASHNPLDSFTALFDPSNAQLNDTRSVVQSFMASAHQRDVEQIMVAVDNDQESPVAADVPSSPAVMTGIISTPDLPPEFQRSPLSPTAEVGRTLAMLAAQFDQQYGGELDEMARLVLPHILGKAAGNAQCGQSLTFQVFRNVASKLFEGHDITWGRIVALLTFGYRLVRSVLRAGLQAFVSRIVDLVCKFIVVEPIASWISSQGGWIQAKFFRPSAENPQLGTMVELGYWFIQALAITFLAVDWFRSR